MDRDVERFNFQKIHREIMRREIVVYIIFISALATYCNETESSLCYASKSLNPFIDGYHSYPLDLFGSLVNSTNKPS